MNALPAYEADATWAPHRKNLDTLAALSTLPAIFDVTGPILIAKFETATRQLPYESLYARAVIDTFHTVLKTDGQDPSKWIDIVFEKLIGECIAVSLSSGTTSSILEDHVLSVVAAIVAYVYQHLGSTYVHIHISTFHKSLSNMLFRH